MGKQMTSATVVTKQRRVRRSETEWQDLFARFEQSGQSREVFCAEQGVVLSSFIRWWKKLHQRLPQQPAMVEAPVFVELGAGREPHWEVELQLGAGVVLRVKRSAC